MAYDYERYQPKTFDELYQSQKALFMPDIRQQRAKEAQFLQQQMQRMGVVNPQQIATQAIEPYAQAFGRAGAGAASKAREMELQEKQYAERVNIQREQLAQQQSQFEQKLAEMEKQRQQQLMMNLFQYTGFSPELLEAAGLESLMGGPGGAGDWRSFQRTLGRYNLPGLPFGMGGGQPFLSAQQKLALQSFYPGSSRSYKNQAAQNWGWLPQGTWGYT